MSDYNSSLPVRTENAGDVIVKVSDATVTTQQLAVNADGSVNITDNGGSLTVDATNLDIRDLAFATDKVDVSGSSVTVSATDLDIRDLAFATDKVDVSGSSVTAVVSATNLDIRDLVFATDKVDVTGSAITAVVSASDLDIRNLSASQDNVAISDGTDTLAINPDGSINVAITDSNPGTPINNFNMAASIAASATSNHDYTVTAGKTFYLNQIEAAGSGKMKIQVQVETGVSAGTFDSYFVQFNSTAETNMMVLLNNPIVVAAGVRVRIIRTNRDNQAQDLYSTISGYEV